MALSCAALIGAPAVAAAQPIDIPEPVVDPSATPRLDPVPDAIAAEVEALRRHVRRTNRCRYGFARTLDLFPQSCVDEFAIVEAASGAVQAHAVGLELVRSLMIPRGQHGRVRYHAMRWAAILGRGERTSARYLVRALSLLDQDSINHTEITRVSGVALQRLTRTPIEPFAPWERGTEDFSNDGSPHTERREPVRRAWLRWYAAHRDETLAQWRASGLQMHRDNLRSGDPVLRVMAASTLYAAEVSDREAVVRAQLASPLVFGRARRHLHRMVVSVWRLMPWREASRITRDAMRERRRQRRSQGDQARDDETRDDEAQGSGAPQQTAPAPQR